MTLAGDAPETGIACRAIKESNVFLDGMVTFSAGPCELAPVKPGVKSSSPVSHIQGVRCPEQLSPLHPFRCPFTLVSGPPAGFSAWPASPNKQNSAAHAHRSALPGAAQCRWRQWHQPASGGPRCGRRSQTQSLPRRVCSPPPASSKPCVLLVRPNRLV